MEEIWKDIEGYEGLYQVSNLGRVKSAPRRGTKGGLLKNSKNTGGYYFVGLYKDNILNRVLVHRIVYETFVGLIPDSLEINHINENKADNRLENLNLMTPKENCNWGTRNNRIKLNRKLKDAG